MNSETNITRVDKQGGQWGLTEELLATKVREWAVTLKHFYLPHAWHRKKHDYKQNVLTLYCQKPIFCYSHSDRITCRLLSVEELKMGKSLIKHKVMCIFPLWFKKHKNAIQILGDALAGTLKALQLLCIYYLNLFSFSSLIHFFSAVSMLIEHFLCINR